MIINLKVANVIQYFLLAVFVPAILVFGYLKFTDQIIGVNVSESLQEKLFLIKKNAPFVKGDLVQFRYIADKEKFLETGGKLVKIIIGIPGDNIEFVKGSFSVNGKAFGKVKPLSKTGRELTQNISKVLDENEFFVFTPHLDSFDSRYIHMGYISSEQIIGKVVLSW